MKSLFKSLVAALCIAVMTGCASTSISNRGERNEIDPFEGYNRIMFGFNDAADRVVVKPIATIYDKYTPELARFIIGNFFTNLGEISNTVNNLLQGKPKAALLDATRFTVNMTIGFLGFSDPASELGLERSNEDFGQTLGVWGLPTGPYLVLPLLGPTSGRDLAGTIFEQPLILTNRVNPVRERVLTRSLQLVDTRASLLKATDLIDGAALDSYTFVRNGYFQRRLSLIYDGYPPPPNLKDDDKADEKAAEPKVVDPKVADPKVADPKVADPKVADPKVADPKAIDAKPANVAPVAPPVTK